MQFYEVLVADSQYKSDAPLTYGYEGSLEAGSVVTVPLRSRMVNGFVVRQVEQPDFKVKPIKSLLSNCPLPEHCLKLASWISQYYACSLGEALRQFAPTKPSLRSKKIPVDPVEFDNNLEASKTVFKLTNDQDRAIKQIKAGDSTTYLLHGETGSGKTEVYLRLARKVLDSGQSVLFLTPEISLTPQLTANVKNSLGIEPVIIHSHLSVAERKKIWLRVLESQQPQVVIGPRSALFVPLNNIGLIVVDEAHEPAYKQDKSPRYSGVRVASKLGALTGAKVILGTATPDIVDYHLAQDRAVVVRMKQLAGGSQQAEAASTQLIDLKDRSNLASSPFLSIAMIEGIKATLNDKRQVLLYLNRRGTARTILCQNCGWQLLCPRCNLSMVYHGDSHLAVCHSCGLEKSPPVACPECAGSDIIYKSIGTKAVYEAVSRLFPDSRIMRFDSDNEAEDRIEKQYHELLAGNVDIIVGTQLLAKGFDLPKLGMVGIIIADTSLFLPDYRADERTYQLLSQVMGRVGRGHGKSRVVIQAYQDKNPAINDAISRNWDDFYTKTLDERKQFGYPPFCFVLKVIIKRQSPAAAEKAGLRLMEVLKNDLKGLVVNGPAPAFHEKSYGKYQWHLILKSPNRSRLVDIANKLPAGLSFDLDPNSLL